MIGSFLLRYWQPAALVVGAAALWVHGNHTGRVSCEHAYQQERIETQERLFKLAEEADKKESQRLAAELERENLARQLEDAAYAEPPSTDCGLPASRVLRLRER